MAHTTLGNPATVSRIDYGTIFEKEAQIYFSSEHWTHTYILALERPVDLNPVLQACNCTSNNNNCYADFKYIIFRLQKLHNKTLENIDNTLENIFTLILEHNFKIVRNKRSLLPIVVDIGKSLFGFATANE